MLKDTQLLVWQLIKVKQVILNGLQLVSKIENKVVPAVGHTTFRPPYTPVSIGAIVGREVGKTFKTNKKISNAFLA